MDYPKSVPSVGLVGGKFVDENPGAGTPGSLIPSAWGNAVTDEILNVIQAAGLNPEEANLDQLLTAIKFFAGSTATTLTETSVLTKAQCGLVLVSAAAAAIVLTLPAASAELGVVEVVLRRIDTASNDLTIAATGSDEIMADVVAGQASIKLKFAGDFLRLRSDGKGKWWCVGRANQTVADATTLSKGVLRLATPEEAVEGISEAIGVTPAGLAARTPGATTLVKGISRFGSIAEQVAGLSNTIMTNPAGVMSLITSLFPKRTFAASDYIRIPDVSGGLIIQWGEAISSGSSHVVNWPIQFPTAVRQAMAFDQTNSSPFYAIATDPNALTNTSGRFVSSGAFGAYGFLAIGN